MAAPARIVDLLLVACIILPLVAGSRRSSRATCSCDCCVAEPRREATVDAGEDAWECVLEQRGLRFESSPFYVHPKACDSLCLQGPGDEVFTSTEAEEVDAQQYCFAACTPKSTGDEGPHQGDLCKPVPSVASTALRRLHGGADPAAAHLLLARKGSQAVGAVAAPAAASGAGGGAPAKWSSVTDPVPEKYVRITEQAAAIKKAYSEVDKGAVADVKKFGKKAMDVVIAGAAAVARAKDAALKAEASERKVRALRDNLRRLAHDEAFRAIPRVLDPLVLRARRAARRAAQKKARKRELEMRIEAPIAAKRAAKPYQDAMRSASETAAEYARQGSELVDTAQATQIEAQAFQRWANVKRAEGSVAEADRLMRRAKALASRAAGMTSKADSFYKTSKSITEVNVPEYARQAGQAAYHAEAMVNPGVEPPLPPII